MAKQKNRGGSSSVQKTRGGTQKSRGGTQQSRSGEPKNRGGQPKARGGTAKQRTGQPKSRSGTNKIRTGTAKVRSGTAKVRKATPKVRGSGAASPKIRSGTPKKRTGEAKVRSGSAKVRSGSAKIRGGGGAPKVRGGTPKIRGGGGATPKIRGSASIFGLSRSTHLGEVVLAYPDAPIPEERERASMILGADLTQAQIDAGAPENVIFVEGRTEDGVEREFNYTVETDSLWNKPALEEFPSAHVAYCTEYVEDDYMDFNQGILAPYPVNYAVGKENAIVRTWGNGQNNQMGITVSTKLLDKWFPFKADSHNFYFMVDSRVAQPISFENYIASIGVGSHRVDIGYGHPTGMDGIEWITYTHVVVLPQHGMTDISVAKDGVVTVLPEYLFEVWGKWSDKHKNAAEWQAEAGVMGWNISTLIAPEYHRLFKSVILSDTGEISIEKSSDYQSLANQYRNGITGGYIPMNLVFETELGSNHHYQHWFKI